MGYNTNFQGTLKFNQQLDKSDYDELEKIFEIDYRKLAKTICRPDLISKHLSYMSLEITSDGCGLQWSGDEKTSNMDSALNLITLLMRERKPDFRLIGEMYAQGEEMGDTWKIVINEDGYTEVIDLDPFKETKCKWSITQIEEDIVEVKTHCGEVMEIDKLLVKEFTYCPFCSGKIDS